MLTRRRTNKEIDPNIVMVDYSEVVTAREDITFRPARDMAALGLAMVVQAYTYSKGTPGEITIRGAKLVKLQGVDTSDPRCNGGTD